MSAKPKTKKPRPSGVAVTMTKGGSINMRSFGPNAPDLRTVIPDMLGGKRLEPRGAIVTGTDPCVCGHSPEEHGHDPEHPGSTACTSDLGSDDPADGCDCVAYEANPDE